jgi:ribosomal protein L37AE/L43A
MAIDIRQVKGHIKDDARYITIKTGERKQVLELSYQRVGFGQRRFFVCPSCEKNTERLYYAKGIWKCRKCSGVNPYEGIQNNTRGGYDEIAYRMKRYAAKQNIQFEFPFDYLQFVLDPRIKGARFRNQIRVLQAMESMRFHALFFQAKYAPKLIRSVIRMEHPLMQKVTLDDLKNNIYDWNTGEKIEMDEGILRSITH